jgi:hypothetical protein
MSMDSRPRGRVAMEGNDRKRRLAQDPARTEDVKSNHVRSNLVESKLGAWSDGELKP